MKPPQDITQLDSTRNPRKMALFSYKAHRKSLVEPQEENRKIMARLALRDSNLQSERKISNKALRKPMKMNSRIETKSRNSIEAHLDTPITDPQTPKCLQRRLRLISIKSSLPMRNILMILAT